MNDLNEKRSKTDIPTGSRTRTAGKEECLRPGAASKVEPAAMPEFLGTERPRTVLVRSYDSPCGRLLLGALGDRLCLCDWRTGKNRDFVDRRLQCLLRARYEEGDSEVVQRAARQLDEYFARRRRTFDIPLHFAGTAFQRSVWRELLKIPYGTTCTYAAVAARLGMPKAVRAVANANRANPLSLFAPCHRVVGSDGSLTGYGGGLAAKRFLLELESGGRLAL